MQPTRATLAAFAALALLLGPISTATADPLAATMRSQPLAGTALTSAIAGLVLLILAASRRERLPTARQSSALLLLVLPAWLLLALNTPALQTFPRAPWGIPLVFALAAPLWLGLLAASQRISMDPPRAAIAACIAGIAAACLIVPTEAYTPTLVHLPAILLHLALAIVTVFTWTYAARHLAGARLLPTAAFFLLLHAAGPALLSLLLERPTWQSPEWPSAILPILTHTAVLAASCSLWFYLLRRLPLAAFTLHPLAAWTASVLSGLVLFGLRNVRADAAFLIALAAVAVALRAPPADEQPVTLGLHTR